MSEPTLLSDFGLSHRRSYDYRLVTLILLLVMLVLRLFSSDPVVGISFDEPKYLALARDFPFHRLYNNELYLMHGPGYPALIRLGMTVMTDHSAAICVSIVMSAIAFWAIGRVGKVIRLSGTGVLLARMFLVFQPKFMVIGQEIYKESTMVALYALLLGGLMSTVSGSRRGQWLAAAAGGFFALTADQNVPLVLISLGMVRLAWPHRAPRLGFVPLIPMLAVWIGTVVVRLIWFSSGPFVAIGMDGMPEPADQLGLLQAIIPNTAPQTSQMVEFDFKENLKYIRDGFFIKYFFVTYELPYRADLWHWVLLLLIPLGAVRACLSGNWRLRRYGIGMSLAAAVLFVVPMLTKPDERYVLLAVIPMAALIGMNGRWFDGRRMNGRPAWWAIAVCTVLAGAWVFASRGNRHFVLGRPLAVEGEVVAEWIKNHETRGIMAQVWYPPELAYLTDRRVVGLPDDPELLEESIRHFDISHIVLGEPLGHRWDWPDRSIVLNSATIDYMHARPDAFRQAGYLVQPAGPGYNRVEFLIIEVNRGRLLEQSKAQADREEVPPRDSAARGLLPERT